MVEFAENFIRIRLPERDENVELINRIVDRIITIVGRSPEEYAKKVGYVPEFEGT